MKLSILCVTRAEPRALPFLADMAGLASLLQAELVIGADGVDARDTLAEAPYESTIVPMNASGAIEHVLDDAVASCRGEYILRIDDDERCSPAMVAWLRSGVWQAQDNWSFPRVALWQNVTSVLMHPLFFPDVQTRLSIKAKSGGRAGVHAPSKFGAGRFAPVVLEHHKFLVRTYTERKALRAHYDQLLPQTWKTNATSCPEDLLTEPVQLAGYSDGAVPWTPSWTRIERLTRVL